MLPDGTGRWLTPRPEPFDGVRDLDGAYLEHALDGFDHEVAYQHGVTEVTELVTSGAVAAAVLIRPTGHHRDPPHRRRAPADAAEVDVLHPQAAHRAGDQGLRLTPT